MHAHRAFGDCETQTGATATLPIARILRAIERTENLFERPFGNTLAAIANTDHRKTVATTILPPQFNFYCRSFRREANRIAHDVLNGAAQQFLNTIYRTSLGPNNLHRTIHAARFEISIFRNVAHQCGEIDFSPFAAVSTALEAG